MQHIVTQMVGSWLGGSALNLSFAKIQQMNISTLRSSVFLMRNYNAAQDKPDLVTPINEISNIYLKNC